MTDTLVEQLHPLSGPLIDLRTVIHPLTQQGEDRIWRAAEKACKLLDKAEDERNAMATTLKVQASRIAEKDEALLEAHGYLVHRHPDVAAKIRKALKGNNTTER